MVKRKKHKTEEIVRKLQEPDVLLKSGKSLASVFGQLSAGEATYCRWRSEYDGMGPEQVKRLKELNERMVV